MDPTSPTQVAAIDIEYIATLGGDRQLRLRTFVERDLGEDYANGVLDRLTAVGERQKARFDLDALEEQFELKGTALRHLIKGIPAAEANHDAAAAERAKSIERLRLKEEQLYIDGSAEHDAGGKRGAYRPAGARKAEMEAVARDVARLIAEGEKAAAERQAFLDSQRQTILHHWTEFGRLRAKLNELCAKAGLGATAGFDDVAAFCQALEDDGA